MRLVKFCKTEHNIENGSKLQIGSLFKYRDIEESSIRDEEEGKFTFDISFGSRTELSIESANAIFGSVIGFGTSQRSLRLPGSFEAHIHEVEIETVTSSTVVIRKASATIVRSVPNCFIFCMSIEDGDQLLSPFPEYDDRWYVSDNNVGSFAYRVGELLLTHSGLSDFESSLCSELSISEARQLSISGRHQPVTYQDREIVISNGHFTNEDMLKYFGDMPFIKPPKFKAEQEYRFLYELSSRQRIFQPQVKEKLLPTTLTGGLGHQ